MASQNRRFRVAQSAMHAVIVRGMTFAMAFVLASAALLDRVQAQESFDISGSWAPVTTQTAWERGYGSLGGDWAGIPLSAAGRAYQLLYSAASQSEPEHTCKLYNQWELADGIAALRFWPVVEAPNDTTVAWKEAAAGSHGPMTIWMDGRSQPSKYTDYPPGGFTVGHWMGDMLITYTTQMKPAAMRRTVAESSDQATMTSVFIPHTNGFMTAVYTLRDSAYLTQPYIYSNAYTRSSTQPVGTAYPPCFVGDIGVSEGEVPFYLPGKNPLVGSMMKDYHIPELASDGGADTMFPAFREKIKDQYLKLYHTFPNAKDCDQFCTSPADILGSGRTTGFP